MNTATTISIFLGLICVVLGVNILYNPSLLVPIVASVLIAFGVLILFLGLLLRRMSSFFTGMGKGFGGNMNNVRVFTANEKNS